MYSYLHMMGDTTKDPCHVPFCRHRDGAEGCDCTFIRFPLDRLKRNQWIQEIGAYGHLEKEPSYLSKICSCHFENGDSSQLPSIFPWTEHPEKYGFPRTERAKKQIAARAAARHKTSLVNFEEEKSKVEKDSVYCDSIILTFDTSQITGNKRSTSMCVGSVSNCEILKGGSLTNGTSTTVKNTEHKSTQTNVLPSIECSLLKAEVEKLKRQIEKISKQIFGVQKIKGREDQFKFYTGVSEKTFNMLVNEVVEIDPRYRPKHLSLEDEILLTLMKLRLNSSHLDISVRFSIPANAICAILTKHIETLHSILFVPMKNYTAITNSGSRVELTALKTQRSIINCANLVAEYSLTDEDGVGQKYTNCKNNFKVLMAVTSDQVITYCSDVFENFATKEEIFKRSDIHNYFKSGDFIVNDRDQSLLKIILKDNSKISEYTADNFRSKDPLCFGRAVRRLRNYQILPFFPPSMFKLATKVVQLCVALTNYQNPCFWDDGPRCDRTTHSIEYAKKAKFTEHINEEHVEVIVPEEETEEVIVSPDIDDEELIEVETEMDGDF